MKPGDEMHSQNQGRRTYFTPRFSDFDIQGVLNSKHYLDFVTEARIEQMRRYYEVPMESYNERNQSWVLASFTIQFRKPIVYPSSFWVETDVASIKKSVAIVTYQFLNRQEQVLAHGQADYYLIDLKTKKPVKILENERDIFLSMSSKASES